MNIEDVLRMKSRFEADSADALLTGIEVSAESYEAMERDFREKRMFGYPIDPKDRVPGLMQVAGVRITKRKPFVSPAMVEAGARAMRHAVIGPSDVCEALAAHVYRAMEAAK